MPTAVSEGESWSPIEFVFDSGEVFRGVHGEVGRLRRVLAQQARGSRPTSFTCPLTDAVQWEACEKNCVRSGADVHTI
jgi:hypothetical protein